MPALIRPYTLAFLLVACSLPLTGCERFFRTPMRVPPHALELPGVADLKGEDLTPASFDKAFPAIDTFIMSARVKAKYRRILGTTYFEMSMATAGPKLLRIAGRHPGDRTTVFDMVFDFPEMHVYLPLQDAYYRGRISDRGSPFGTGFGVEPWDMIPIIEIGRRLAFAEFDARRGLDGTELVMSEKDLKADGLERVQLNRESGLPEEAWWRRGDIEYRVVYEAWDVFESINKPGEQHLLPTEFYVQRNTPYALVKVSPREELQQFKVEPELSKQTFQLIFPQATAFYPLEDLENLLGGG